MSPVDILERVEHHPIYIAALVFFAWYPILMSLVWIFTGSLYFLRRERRRAQELPPATIFDGPMPTVSFLIPAYNEDRHIRATIEAILRVDYPDFEVVVIDDCSSDDTVAQVLPLVRDGRVRLMRKSINEGKAMALNDAFRLARGEIVVVMDADACPDPQLLRTLVPHFRHPRVGGVTGNPRVANRESFLAKLQAIEFTSIISLQRRAQRVWGRILTMSGVVGAFHRNALLDVGLYSPDMATEDIDLTWKLQLRHWDVRYEPRALVWMNVPVSLRGLWHQRVRWAWGLAQVLRRHGRSALRWENRRMWPVLTEACASIVWAYTYMWMVALWITSYSLGYPPVGASPVPNWWGMLICTICLLQLFTGVVLDRRYDLRLTRYYGVAVLYPIIYWMLQAMVTTWSTPRALLERKGGRAIRWTPVRDA